MKQFLVYSRLCGFNIINAESEEDVDDGTSDSYLLDEVSEVDPQIITRVKELICDE